MSLLSSADFSFETIVFKIYFRNTSRVSNNMDPDDTQRFFSLIWVQAVRNDYQRKQLSMTILYQVMIVQ